MATVEVQPPGMVDEAEQAERVKRLRNTARKSKRASVSAFLSQKADEGAKYENTEDLFEELAASIIDEQKRATTEANRAGYWKKMSVGISLGAMGFFGVMFGVMIASNEISKESHVTVAENAGNNIVAAGFAKEDVPLKYLPVMDIGALSQAIGQPIMFKKGPDTVYEFITAISKPSDGTLSVTISTQSGVQLIVDTDAAMLTYDTPDGPVTEPLWGSVNCAKLTLDSNDVLEAKLKASVGEEGLRRLQAAEGHASYHQGHARRLSAQKRARKLASFDGVAAYTDHEFADDACFEYWPGSFFAWKDWSNCKNDAMGPWLNLFPGYAYPYRAYFGIDATDYDISKDIPEGEICLRECTRKEILRPSSVFWSTAGGEKCGKVEMCWIVDK